MPTFHICLPRLVKITYHCSLPGWRTNTAPQPPTHTSSPPPPPPSSPSSLPRGGHFGKWRLRVNTRVLLSNGWTARLSMAPSACRDYYRGTIWGESIKTRSMAISTDHIVDNYTAELFMTYSVSWPCKRISIFAPIWYLSSIFFAGRAIVALWMFPNMTCLNIGKTGAIIAAWCRVSFVTDFQEYQY